jgi:hypothetical protein
MILRALWLFFALLFSLSSLASDKSFLRLSPNVVVARLQKFTATPEERPAMLRKAFQEAGCAPEQITEQLVPGNPITTVMCTLPGSEAGSIIVSAGLDYRSEGEELSVDNATLELLPLLVQSVRNTSRRHSLVFIGFTGGKKQAGSNYYLSQLSDAQRKDIRGMIFLDHIGRSPVRYLHPSQWNEPGVSHMGDFDRNSSHDPTPLNKWLDVAALSVNMGYPYELKEFYFTHALSFERKRIDALTLTSPAYIVVPRPRNNDVRMQSTTVDMASFYETYNLLCVYLLKLDSSLKAKN